LQDSALTARHTPNAAISSETLLGQEGGNYLTAFLLVFCRDFGEENISSPGDFVR
jgi:hypothetical protein